MIDKATQIERAKNFLARHQAPKLLVLANAWDAVSARIFEIEKFEAIGTTSAGISACLGYPDGEKITADDTARAVRCIVDCVRVPVSADIEAGYATDIAGVVETTRKVMNAGAVGINIEDSTGDPDRPFFDTDEQVEKIAAIRAMADSETIPLVINARADFLMLTKGDMKSRLSGVIERGNEYAAAGADCVFVPDMEDLDRPSIITLVKEIDAPLNLIVGKNSPNLAELEQLGVARVSFGPRAMRASLALLRKIAREISREGTYELMCADALSYAEINGMFSGRDRHN